MGEGEQPVTTEPDKTSSVKNRDKKLSTKIVCRRLPPNMTEESFLEQVSPIPEHDYFYFAKPDLSLAPDLFCRAYINFINVDDVYSFRDRFDDYIFLDDKGNEYPAIVEYAPFPRIPKKKRKKDPKSGTLEADPSYLDFLESLKEIDSDAREPKLEYSYQLTDGEEKKDTTTPLLDYLAAKKKEDRRRREERQQRRKPKNRNSKDDDDCEEEVKKIKTRKADDKQDDEEDIDNVEGKEFPAKGKGKNYKDSKQAPEDNRKKSEYKRNKDKGDHNNADDEKFYRKDKKHPKDNFKEKNKEKNFERKEKSKFPDKKTDKSIASEEKYSKTPEKQVHAASVKSADKPDKPPAAAAKSPALLSSKIKPFTTLPQLKTEELSKLIDELDINSKKDTPIPGFKIAKEKEDSPDVPSTNAAENKNSQTSLTTPDKPGSEVRRSSLEPKEKESNENALKRNKSLDEKSRPEKMEKSGKESDPRLERRIRNKDRPSLAIYQPGMGKFSKQRLEREKGGDATAKSVGSENSSSNSINSQD